MKKDTPKEIGGFTVLEDVQSSKKVKLKRVLPHWLKNPILIGNSLTNDLKKISEIPGLSQKTREILQKENVKLFFPVQEAVIPALLKTRHSPVARYQPRDICVSAPTGSGKTLAYVLPIVELLKKRVERHIRALIILPVQELAQQVYKVFLRYGNPLGLHIGLAVGLKSFKMEQMSLVQQNFNGHTSMVDILIATPGRLTDHIYQTPGFDLSYLRYLVLDEADRLLTGEVGDVIKTIEREILKQIPPRPNVMGNLPYLNYFSDTEEIPMPNEPLQRLLFSATLSHDPEQLQHISLYRPMLFTVTGGKKELAKEMAIIGQYSRPSELTEKYVTVVPSVKPLVLHHLIKTKKCKKTLVFTNSRQDSHKLALLLCSLAKDDYTVQEFSADQGTLRKKTVSQFTSGKIDVLVSTDVMARGIDIPDIEYVISYDVTSLSTYIHRIGRTARGGKEGIAISIITTEEEPKFKPMITGTTNIEHIDVESKDLELYEKDYVEALEHMKNTILEEKKEGKDDTEKSENGKRKGSQHKRARFKKPKLTGSNLIKIK